jgi:hypothetical protein
MLNVIRFYIVAEHLKSSEYNISCYFFDDDLLMTMRKKVTEVDKPCSTPFSWKKVSEKLLEVLT